MNFQYVIYVTYVVICALALNAVERVQLRKLLVFLI